MKMANYPLIRNPPSIVFVVCHFLLLTTLVKESNSNGFEKHAECVQKCSEVDRQAAEEGRTDCTIDGNTYLPCARDCLGIAIAPDPEACWCDLCKKKKGRQFCKEDRIHIHEKDCDELVCGPQRKVKYGNQYCKHPNPDTPPDEDSDE